MTCSSITIWSAEAFRYLDLPYEKFWGLSKSAQAELIWNALFIEHSPISEACRGVLTTLQALDLDVRQRDLPALRRWFAQWTVEDYIDKCMELGGVRNLCMTNSPFDDQERPVWEKGFNRDSRFTAGLRIDPLLLSWKEAAAKLRAWGYKAGPSLSSTTVDAVRRFLSDWTERIHPKYLMVSLPPDFLFPGTSDGARLIEKAVLPHCREFGLPFALMPGVKRAVNPALRLARDGEGLTNLDTVGEPLRRVSRKQVPDYSPGARESARAVCARPKVPKPARVWMLVVHQHSLPGRRDDPDAHRTGRTERHAAAFRRPGSLTTSFTNGATPGA